MTVQTDAVRLWDFPAGQPIKEFFQREVHSAALSPDGRRLATSSFNHDLRLWDVGTGEELIRLPDIGRQGGSRSFIFTGNSQRLVSWEADYRLLVWNVNAGRLIAENGPRLDGLPKDLLDDDSRPRRRAFGGIRPSFWSSFCFFPDGSRFLWHSKKLQFYETATGKELHTFGEEIGAGWYPPQISKDQEWLLLGGGRDERWTLFNLRLGKIFGRLDLGNGVRSGAPGALSPDGRCVALDTSSGANHKIVLYETATLRPRVVIPLEYGYAYRLAFSPEGRFLAAALIDGTVLVWDVIGREN